MPLLFTGLVKKECRRQEEADLAPLEKVCEPVQAQPEQAFILAMRAIDQRSAPGDDGG